MAGTGMMDRTGDLPAFAGVVLAGGHSSRMGCDKAELTYHGRTLLAHTLARLQACGADPIVISGPPRTGYVTVADHRPNLGPLGGIHAALSNLANESSIKHLLIVPVDMPALGVSTLTALIRFGSSAAACHYEGHPLPLSLTLNDGILENLSRIVNDAGLPDSQRSMHAFCVSLKAQSLPLPHASTAEFLSLNTPAEWAAFSTEHTGVHAG